MSTPQSQPPSFPLPQVQKALSSYIQPASEVLRSRQLLTYHHQSLSALPRVASASGSAEELDRFLDREISKTAGIRRAHLKALRENFAAKAEYNAALASLNVDIEDDKPIDEEGWKRSYVSVLRLKRKQTRLMMLREAVATLASTAAERPHGRLVGVYAQRPPPQPEELSPQSNVNANAAEQETMISSKIESVILNVQKEIVRMQDQLIIETARLRQLQKADSSGNRLQALQAISVALTDWLEEKTSVAPPDDVDNPQSNLPAIKQPTEVTTPDGILASISKSYATYLSSRSELLQTLARKLPNKESVPPLQTEPDTTEPLTTHFDPAPPAPTPTVVNILTGTEHLLPILHAQKAILAAQNVFTADIARQRASLVDLFDGAEPVKRARGNADSAARSFAEAELHAKQEASKAKDNLRAGLEVAGEVGRLCERKKNKSSLPVRGAKSHGRERGQSGGLWGGLGGRVGVIGDGI